MLVCPPARPDSSPRLQTRGVAHTPEDSVPPHVLLYLILPLLHVLLYLIPPLQVQGSGDVVLERLRLVLNQLAADRAAREINDGEHNDEPDYPDDDGEDNYDVDGPLIPTDFPVLFSDDVSCLMLL